MKEIVIQQLELKLEMQLFPGEGTPASEIHTWGGRADSVGGLGIGRYPSRAFPVLSEQLSPCSFPETSILPSSCLQF